MRSLRPRVLLRQRGGLVLMHRAHQPPRRPRRKEAAPPSHLTPNECGGCTHTQQLCTATELMRGCVACSAMEAELEELQKQEKKRKEGAMQKKIDKLKRAQTKQPSPSMSPSSSAGSSSSNSTPSRYNRGGALQHIMPTGSEYANPVPRYRIEKQAEEAIGLREYSRGQQEGHAAALLACSKEKKHKKKRKHHSHYDCFSIAINCARQHSRLATQLCSGSHC